MPFEQAFKLSSLFLTTVALAGLVLAHSVPAWLIMLTGSLLVFMTLQAAGIAVFRWNLPRITDSSNMSNLLLVSGFLIFLLDLTVVSRDLLSAGIHFLVTLLGIKLVSLNQRRDFRHLYAICLM